MGVFAPGPLVPRFPHLLPFLLLLLVLSVPFPLYVAAQFLTDEDRDELRKRTAATLPTLRPVPCEERHPACCRLLELCRTSATRPKGPDRYVTLAKQPGGERYGATRKYDRYAQWACLAGLDNWVVLSKADHDRIASDLFRAIAQDRSSPPAPPLNGSIVLDWGAGCGTKARFLERTFRGAAGFGIDLSPTSVQYANAVAGTRSCFCHADGAHLGFLPAAAFDHVVSFGAVYHLFNGTYDDYPRRITDLVAHDPTLCDTLREMLRVVKPRGRIVLSGHLQNPHREYYAQCRDRLLRERGTKRFNLSTVQEWAFHRRRVGRVYWGPAKDMRRLRQTYTVIIRVGDA